MKIEQVMTAVDEEKMREDKMFKGLEFNVRGEDVVMNYVYDDFTGDTNVNSEVYMPHGKDPVFMNEEEMTALIDELNEKNIYYNVRKDDFI